MTLKPIRTIRLGGLVGIKTV